MSRYFAINTAYKYLTSCSVQSVTSGDAFATDSSGYHMYVTNYTNGTVYAPDGTLVTTSGPDAQGHYIGAKDANGNYISSQTVYGTNSNVTSFFDTVDRAALVYTNQNCVAANQSCLMCPTRRAGLRATASPQLRSLSRLICAVWSNRMYGELFDASDTDHRPS